MNTPICWFEIPVADLDRATRFYQDILATQLRPENCGGHAMAIFPYAEGQPSGALIAAPQLQPSAQGTLIYLNGGADLNTVLARIPAAGGRIDMEKTDLGQSPDGKAIGHIALFIDSEGNRVGLYSPN